MPLDRDRLHFVGSIPLSNSEEVFRQLSTQVGPFLRRMPDGETGERILWIKFQQKMLFEHPAMELDTTQPPLPVRQADGTVHRPGSSRMPIQNRLNSKPAMTKQQRPPTACFARFAMPAWLRPTCACKSPCRRRWQPA